MQEIVCMAFNNGAKVELRENQSVKHLLYRSTATTRLGEATCLTSSKNTLIWICPPITLCEFPSGLFEEDK
jgi:hypothetical protein